MSALAASFRELRTTFALAAPIVAGHLGQILLGLTDSVMIGQVGRVPLAASAFAGAVFGWVYVTVLGLLTAVAVRASVAHGAGRPRDAGEVVRHGLAMALTFGVVAAFGVQVLAGQLHRFGQPPEVVAEARAYLTIIGWSLVPGLAFAAVKQFYEALHRPWVPMAWVLAGVGLNAFLNWIFIYGHLGAPALGLAGAGWASLISRVVVIVGIAAHLMLAPALAAARPLKWMARLDLAEIRALLALGLPASFQLLFEVGLFSVSALLMGFLGTVALAAHQVALSCAAATFMFPLGISQALTVRLGNARGANRPELLRPIGLGGIGAGAALMGAFGIVFVFAGGFLAGLFIDDTDVIALAARLLIVAGVFQLFDGTQVTSIGALRGLADVQAPTVITFVGYWVLALPAAWALAFPVGWGAMGVWAGLAVGLAACAALLLARLVRLTGRLAVA